MKKIIFLTLLVLLSLTACSQKDTSERTTNSEKKLIVGTFNIDAKEQRDTDKQRKYMSDNHVEIFGIQEVNYNNKRFADKGVEKYNPLPDFKKIPYKYDYYGNAIDFARGGYGIATISSSELSDKTTTKLVTTEQAKLYNKEFEDVYKAYDPTKPETVKAMDGMWEDDGIANKGAMEPRVYTRVVFKKDGKEIAFYNTHMSYETKEIRKKQMEQLQSAMKNDPVKYTIAVGDFNADQSTKEFDLYRKEFNMANGGKGIWYDTFTEKDDSMLINSIDNIIVSKNIEIKSVKYEKVNLSDHLPLIAELVLK